MALKILDTCVNCDVCEPACPNQAISLGEDFYEIDPDRCTECVGHFDLPQCIDPEHVESDEKLRDRYTELTGLEPA